MSKVFSMMCSLFLFIFATIQAIVPVFAEKNGNEETIKLQGYGYELEPNNVPAKADWTYSEKAAYGRIQAKDDIDYWRIKATGEGSFTASLTLQNGVHYKLQVFDEDEKELAQSNNGDSDKAEIGSIPVTKDKWYYFAVSSSNGSFDKKNYYMLKVVFVPSGMQIPPDSYEPNNSPEAAKTVNGGDFLEATVHDSSDVDYYKFSVQLGSTIELTLSEIPQDMDLDLFLLDKNLKPVMKSANAKNKEERIVYQGDPGTYYIQVLYNNRSSLVMNHYRLRVNVNTMPVILIPGIGGSRLTKLEDGTSSEAWLNISGMLVNEEYHRKALSLMPKEPGSEQVVQRFPNVAIIPEEGDQGFRAIEYLSYGDLKSQTEQYHSMAQHLQSLGYKKGVSLFGFPYDWRLSSSKNAEFLKQAIDQALKNSYARQVQLVVHSMGGLLVKETLLSNPSYQKKVKRIVYLGTPFLGSPSAYEALRKGYNFGIMFFSTETSQQICQYAPAVFELLPSRQYMSKQNYLYLNSNGKLTPFTYQDLYRDRRVNSIYQPLLASADRQHAKWDSRLLQVPQYMIIGDGQLTLLGFQIIEATNMLNPFFDKGEGDGTVPFVSGDFSLKDVRKKYYISELHAKLPVNMYVIHQVANLLLGIEQVQNGLREKPKQSTGQIDYLIIYREDGQIPQMTVEIGGKMYLVNEKVLKQPAIMREDQGPDAPKIEQVGDAVVIILPAKYVQSSVRLTPKFMVDGKSNMIVQRHLVDSNHQEKVTNYKITSNNQTTIFSAEN